MTHHPEAPVTGDRITGEQAGGKVMGERRERRRLERISSFIASAVVVVAGCVLLASIVARTLPGT